MRQIKRHNDNEESFWISATDMMAGMLAVVLLLLMLFILYLNLSSNREVSAHDATEAPYNNYSTPDEYHSRVQYDPDDGTDDDHDDDDSHGSNGNGQTVPTEAPTVSTHDGREYGRDKTAVFVTVVDDDTGNTIKKSGTEFELYADKNGIGGLQKLNTYYPDRIEYTKYTTTSQGTFYLPEKITRGWYSLHNTVPPEGYYIDENTDFEIDKYWDWSEPYMVEVRMKPIKSVIRVQVNDGDSTEPVEGAVFNVIAARDIVTVDGTVRYKQGEIVDEIETNEKGYTESKELYIGEYTIKQIKAPAYYALNKTNASAVIEEDMQKNTGIVSVECSKTKFTVNLTDERTQEPVAGAVYSMEGREDPVTDNDGSFVITDLEKEVKYTLNAKSLPDGYLKKDTEIVFTVDNDGMINSSASYVYQDTAYTISAAVGIKDLFFERAAQGIDLVLTDENDNVIEEWTSSDSDRIISKLKTGRYYIRKPNETEILATVDLEDKAELQRVTIKTWDTIDLFAILIGVGIIILAVIITGAIIGRRKARKKRERKA